MYITGRLLWISDNRHSNTLASSYANIKFEVDGVAVICFCNQPY